MFFGHDGLDELTVTTTSTVYELEDGDVRIYDVDPLDVGIPRAELGALAGGDAAGNAAGGPPGVRRGDRARSATSSRSTPPRRCSSADVVPDLAAGVELAARAHRRRARRGHPRGLRAGHAWRRGRAGIG